ncbi:hypothetical protein KC727_00085 [Candidatus Kaiserbacteria bacterium]|nr:hypothetical protein [Candidatus Kaiserbacteria bacterium]
MMQYLRTTVLKSLLASFMVLAMVMVVYSPSAPTTRHAQAKYPVIDVTNLSQNIITAIQTAGSYILDVARNVWAYADYIKEYLLDLLNWGLVNLILEKMIASVTDWVNSGFNGSPAFVTDLKQFLVDIADEEFGRFIDEELGLGILCSPFSIDVRLALEIGYQETFREKAQCTLSGVIDNVQGFFDGDFASGGWDGWFNVVTKPQNNPYGILLTAQSEASIRIKNAEGREVKLLDFGKGFLSFKDENGQISTPGTVVEGVLETHLGIPPGRLTVADEIDELVGALLGQLVNAVFGTGGLRGLSSSGYTNRLYNDTGELPPSLVEGGNLATQIEVSVSDEENYRTELYQLIAVVEEAEVELQEWIDERCDIEIPEYFTELKTDAETTIAEIDTLLVRLNDILARTTSPDSDIAKQAFQEYGNMLARRELHQEAAGFNIKFTNEILPKIYEIVGEAGARAQDRLYVPEPQQINLIPYCECVASNPDDNQWQCEAIRAR